MRRLIVVLAMLGAASAREAATVGDWTSPSRIAPENAITIAPSDEATSIRVVGPLVDTYALRFDRGLVVARTVGPGDAILTGVVGYARTARLTEDIQIRRHRSITTLPAGLAFYRIDEVAPADAASALAIGPGVLSAWCTPDRSWDDGAALRGAGATCLVLSRTALFGQSRFANVVAAAGHPLAPNLLNLDGAPLVRAPALEETPLTLPGEMDVAVDFLGVRGRNLAARMAVRIHFEGYTDVVRAVQQEAVIMPDRSAYFAFGPETTMQLRPISDSTAYAVQFSGAFGQWLSQHAAAPSR